MVAVESLDQSSLDIVFIGPVGSGKSSLIGSLVRAVMEESEFPTRIRMTLNHPDEESHGTIAWLETQGNGKGTIVYQDTRGDQVREGRRELFGCVKYCEQAVFLSLLVSFSRQSIASYFTGLTTHTCTHTHRNMIKWSSPYTTFKSEGCTEMELSSSHRHFSPNTGGCHVVSSGSGHCRKSHTV